MSITEIPSVEAADLLCFSGVQVYYKGKEGRHEPSRRAHMCVYIDGAGFVPSPPSAYTSFTFGVETE